MKLSNATLADLPETVARPSYDRGALTPGIVHVGVGNFHRAHQAVYLDDLFNTGRDHDWAIVGAGIMAGDAKMRDRLAGQDWLSTIVSLDPEERTARVTGPMIDFVAVEPGNGPLIKAMSRPEIRIVSMTVTEGGYYLDAATEAFNPGHPDIMYDAANPAAPKTVFGAIAAALRARRDAGVEPFTVMSCDNLPHNGHVARDAVVGVARLTDPDLAKWIADNVAFPCGMVDRITPATGQREIDRVARDFGIEDAAPVQCEPFRQWVLEDNFPTGRPAFEAVGVTFTDRVDAFETMKIRILNGGHAIIAYPGALMDLESVHDAMVDPLVSGFLDKLERDEVIPIVPPVPDTDLNEYYAKIVERFANPEVGDTLRRLCLDGSNRQPKFIVPTMRDNIREGRMPDGLILLSALWCRYCAGTTEGGAEIAPNDPNWDMLTARAKKAKTTPSEWLSMTEVYGNLGRDKDFSDRFAHWLGRIWEEGTKAVLTDFLKS